MPLKCSPPSVTGAAAAQLCASFPPRCARPAVECHVVVCCCCCCWRCWRRCHAAPSPLTCVFCKTIPFIGMRTGRGDCYTAADDDTYGRGASPPARREPISAELAPASLPASQPASPAARTSRAIVHLPADTYSGATVLNGAHLFVSHSPTGHTQIVAAAANRHRLARRPYI